MKLSKSVIFLHHCMNFAEQFSGFAWSRLDWIVPLQVKSNSFTAVLKEETCVTPFASTVSYKSKRTRRNSNTQGHTENPAFFYQDFNEKILK